RRLLSLAGYSGGSMTGARMRAIKQSRGYTDMYVLPYIDGAAYVTLVRARTVSDRLVADESHYFLIDAGSGEQYEAGSTSGLSAPTESPMFTCNRCDAEYDADSEGGDGYCGECYEHSPCDRCDDMTANDDLTYLTRTNGRLSGHSGSVCSD